MHAVSCLPAVTGAWKYRGGGALYSNRSIYRWDMSLIEGTETLDPNIRSLDMSRIGEVLSGNKKDLQGGPEVAAMLIQNTNPSCVAPDSSKVNDGLKKEDLFLCVHEQFMTDTAKLADIVLPATTFLEHDDIYQAGGHSHILLGPKIIEPFSQAKDNHYVICNIAKRLGAKHRGFNMSPLEIIDEMLSKAGWPSVASLKKTGWHDCMPSFKTAHHLNGWPTHDKKFHFNAIWQTELSAANSSSNPAMPKLPDHMPVIKKADNQHPFRLIYSASTQFFEYKLY